MAQVLRREQVGQGLVVADAKLKVRAGAGIVVDNAGVSLDPTALPDVPKAVANIAINGNTVTKTFTDGSSSEEQLPAQTVDVKLDGLDFVDGKLQATLTNGETKETEFDAEFLVSVIEALPEDKKDAVVDALLPSIFKKLKGEEVKDFADVQLGFLLKKDDE